MPSTVGMSGHGLGKSLQSGIQSKLGSLSWAHQGGNLFQWKYLKMSGGIRLLRCKSKCQGIGKILKYSEEEGIKYVNCSWTVLLLCTAFMRSLI